MRAARNRYIYIGSLFSFSEIYTLIGKEIAGIFEIYINWKRNSMHLRNICILTTTFYILTEDKYITFWDDQMTEGQRTTIFS
jgi:hypothetical protein